MTKFANFFVRIEQVIIFPNTVIYKKTKLVPQLKRPPSSTSALAIPTNRRYTLEPQPIGKNPQNFTNGIVK